MASQNKSSYTLTKLLSHTSNEYQQDIAQQLPYINSSVADKDTNNQIPETMMDSSGHFANNQINDDVVVYMQGR
jgi:hypothetical protein